jgi:hypothetical protein
MQQPTRDGAGSPSSPGMSRNMAFAHLVAYVLRCSGGLLQFTCIRMPVGLCTPCTDKDTRPRPEGPPYFVSHNYTCVSAVRPS